MSDTDLHTKVAKHDSDIEGLVRSTATLASSINALSDSVHDGFRTMNDSLVDQISNVHERFNKARETSWPTVFMGVSLIIVIITLFLTIYSQQRTEMATDISELQKWRTEQAYQQGVMDTNSASTSQRIEVLEWKSRSR